jgi:hypothetical protein
MISALSPLEILRFFGFVVVLSAVLVFLVYILPSKLRRASGATTFVRYALYSVALASGILLIVSDHRIVDLAWRTLPFLDRFAPNLNGTFTLQTSSNWPLQKRMRDAYEARSGSATGEEVNIDQLQPTQGLLRVQMGLFTLHMNYESHGTGRSRSQSEVVASSLRRNPSSGEFELWYNFAARVPDPLPTDEQVYFGAGVWRFAVKRGRVCEMEGSYWTNRAWRQGLNTAGNAIAQADCTAQTTPALVEAASDRHFEHLHAGR